MGKLLTIGMATYDDYDGVFFSTQALRMYHKICNTDQVEFVILDNNPTGKHAEQTKRFTETTLKGKYVTNNVVTSFSKYKIADYASGKYVLVMDCHVLLVENAIDNLLKYYSDNPKCKNLVQGPLLYDNLTSIATHFNPEWSGHMWGTWKNNKEAYDLGEPFEIPMQGMGLFSFEREFYPNINKNFRGFGAEEGYIAEKFRQNGGKNICLPSLKWVHRFNRPNGVPFRLTLNDRIFNYFIGWMEFGIEHPMIKSIYDYFITQMNERTVKELYEEAKSYYN